MKKKKKLKKKSRGTKEYNVLIDYSKFKKDSKKRFNELLKEKSKSKKDIVANENNVALIKVELFDSIQYRLEDKFKKQALISLVEKNEDGTVSTIIEKTKLFSDDYYLLLRTIRF